MFNKMHRDVCPKCYEEEEELLRQTQDYLRDNRQAHLFEIVDALDIEQWMIEKWVKEKRINLITTEDQKAVRQCTECGRKLKETDVGAICKTCQLKKLMKKGAQSPKAAEKEEEKKEEARGMYFKKRD
ncbi:MAG: hypothetical protein C4527_14995 [Candidatus Omnitrophota bacterium]|nr:MAG: hypothetical protein C4527_14995 [Candidatus Omnitrophota bacterium]